MFDKLNDATLDIFELNGKSLLDIRDGQDRQDEEDRKASQDEQARQVYNRRKNENIERYRKQIEKSGIYHDSGQFKDLSGELDYTDSHIDHNGLYDAEVRFVKYAGLDT